MVPKYLMRLSTISSIGAAKRPRRQTQICQLPIHSGPSRSNKRHASGERFLHAVTRIAYTVVGLEFHVTSVSDSELKRTIPVRIHNHCVCSDDSI